MHSVAYFLFSVPVLLRARIVLPLTIYQHKIYPINNQLAKSLRIVKELNAIDYHTRFTSHGEIMRDGRPQKKQPKRRV